MVKAKRYRTLRNISIARSEAAIKRIQAGEAKPDDWLDLAEGKVRSLPDAIAKRALAAGDIEEVTT